MLIFLVGKLESSLLDSVGWWLAAIPLREAPWCHLPTSRKDFPWILRARWTSPSQYPSASGLDSRKSNPSRVLPRLLELLMCLKKNFYCELHLRVFPAVRSYVELWFDICLDPWQWFSAWFRSSRRPVDPRVLSVGTVRSSGRVSQPPRMWQSPRGQSLRSLSGYTWLF